MSGDSMNSDDDWEGAITSLEMASPPAPPTSLSSALESEETARSFTRRSSRSATSAFRSRPPQQFRADVNSPPLHNSTSSVSSPSNNSSLPESLYEASPKRRRLLDPEPASVSEVLSAGRGNMDHSTPHHPAKVSSPHAPAQGSSSSTAGSATESSSASSSSKQVQAGTSKTRESELCAFNADWLQRTVEWSGSPFVAVFRGGSSVLGGEDLMVTPLDDHTILQSENADVLQSPAQDSGKGKDKAALGNNLKDGSAIFGESSDDLHLRSHASIHSMESVKLDEWAALNTRAIPVEVFSLIIRHLSHHDVKNMRLVDKAFEQGVSAYMFERVVLPFNKDIYGMLTDDAQKKSTANVKGKAPATEIPPNLALDMFRGFGRHVRYFGINFDVDRKALARPPPKKMRSGHKAYWGKYEWCFPDYVRFSDQAALENAADETTIMTKALSCLSNVQHLAISLDAGLGWLQGPGRSLRDRILDEQSAVWESSRYQADQYQLAHRQFWLMVEDTFRRANKLDDLYDSDLVRLNHPHNSPLVEAARSLPSTLTMRKSFLANVHVTMARDSVIDNQMIDNRIVPQSILDNIPRRVWVEACLHPFYKKRWIVSWYDLWNVRRYAPFKRHLKQSAEVGLPPADVLSSPPIDAKSEEGEELPNEILDQLKGPGNDCVNDDEPPHSRSYLSETISSPAARTQIPVSAIGDTKAATSTQRSSGPLCPANELLAILPSTTADDTDSATQPGRRNATRFLDSFQKEWLLETAWAQEAFISTYMLAITDNRHMAANIKTLTLTRFSSKHVSRLYRDDFWNALSGLTEISLSIIADWRDVIYDISASAETTEVSPAAAISIVHYLLTSQIVYKRSLRKLSLGWVDGGEEAQGYFARNKNVLPAPLVPREQAITAAKLFPDMPVFSHLEELRLHNCWITPNLLEYFIWSHKSLSLCRLTLDSVSLTAHPGLAPNGNVHANAAVQGVWAQVLTGLLPGLQRLGNGVLQPPAVITGVQQLAMFATSAGVQLPPNVSQFLVQYPLPLLPGQAFHPGSNPPIPPNSYEPVMAALDLALAPTQVQGQPVPGQHHAALEGPNATGYLTGSWPDIIKKLTEMLNTAGKPEFKFAFLSCGYVLMPGRQFDQTWLHVLSKQVDRELNYRRGEDDGDMNDENVMNRMELLNHQVQPQVMQPQFDGLNQTANNATQARPVSPPRRPLVARSQRNRMLNRDAPAYSFPHARMKPLLRGVQKSNDPLLGRIITALPPTDRTGLLLDWPDIQIGWPTAVMELEDENDAEEEVDLGNDGLDARARKGWGRWGERTKEGPIWDGQMEGGSGRFSGWVVARDGATFCDSDDDDDNAVMNGEGSSNDSN